MFYVNKELIEEELKRDKDMGFDYSYQKLSNKFMNRLFNHYYIEELCENFYDSEPDFDEEELNMYMDYRNSFKLTGLTFWNLISNMEEIKEKKQNFKYAKQSHTLKELKAAHDKVVQMYKDYEATRINFNNWQELYFEGNWGMSQRYIDSYGRNILKRIRNFPKSKKERLYAAKKEDEIRIYFYGRDFLEVDYWFIFRKRKRRLR